MWALSLVQQSFRKHKNIAYKLQIPYITNENITKYASTSDTLPEGGMARLLQEVSEGLPVEPAAT